MDGFLYLVPISLGLGAIGLAVFLWTLRKGQYDDLDGAAERILHDEDTPLPTPESPTDNDAGNPPSAKSQKAGDRTRP